jgi:hypothetical protein
MSEPGGQICAGDEGVRVMKLGVVDKQRIAPMVK